MRTLLVLLLLSATAFAGCTGNADTDSIGGIDVGAALNGAVQVAGTYGTHADYGFLTQGMVPMTTDGQTRVVNDDGTISWFRPAGVSWSGLIPTGIEAVANVASTAQNADGEEVIVQGHGVALFGPLAIYGGITQTQPPLIVVDFTDPTNPVEVGRNDEVPVRDAETILYPDGRLVVITTGGQRVQYATDITDPTNPTLIAETETAHGNHNIAVVPGTPIVYNTGSSGSGFIDILDYSDPANPVVAGTFWNKHACHDITFYMSPEEAKYRAYCAASSGDRVQIWDIADPLQPRMINDYSYPTMDKALPETAEGEYEESPVRPSPGIHPLSISHLAMVNHDASILIVGDETGGGGINGCDFYYEADGETISGPTGNLWFYDISDETAPVLLGHVSPEAYDGFTEGDPTDVETAATGSCTSHFGRLVEDTDFLVMSFYSSGVLLIDFTDPEVPVITDRLVQGDVWDVWYQDGWLITGDMSRGLDVLKLV